VVTGKLWLNSISSIFVLHCQNGVGEGDDIRSFTEYVVCRMMAPFFSLSQKMAMMTGAAWPFVGRHFSFKAVSRGSRCHGGLQVAGKMSSIRLA